MICSPVFSSLAIARFLERGAARKDCSDVRCVVDTGIQNPLSVGWGLLFVAVVDLRDPPQREAGRSQRNVQMAAPQTMPCAENHYVLCLGEKLCQEIV